MNPDLEKKIDAIYESVEKTRKYFKWTMIITIIVIVLPLLASLLIIPSLISSFNTISGMNIY